MKYNNRILIVDDTESIHEDFNAVLSYTPKHPNLDLQSFLDGVLETEAPVEPPEQYRIDSAFQGEEALLMVQKALEDDDPYALIFMDVRMPPGWDGIRTSSEIWHCAPETEIVICTAYSDYSWDAILDKLGTSDKMMFLKKPFDSITVKQMALSQVRKWNLGYKSRSVMETLELEVQKRTAQLEESMTELESSKLIIEDIIDSVSAALFLVDSSFVLQGINHSAANYFNIKGDKDKARGQSLFEIIAPENVVDTAKLFDENLRGVSISGEEDPFEWSITPQGLTSVHYFNASITRLHGNRNQYLVTLYDITNQREERHYLQRKQRMESVGLLAGGIAHEFNNIIAGIQGYAQLALKGESEELYRRGAEVTERQCKRAAELVRGLLTFSRTGSAGSERVDVGSVCDEVITLTSKNSGAKLIEIERHLKSKIYIEGESGPFQQIIMNLIINAQHAMSTTAVRKLTISTDIVKDKVHIKVSDTGHGIDTKSLPHVFDPFFTTKGALGGGGIQGKIHGTGLGLSVVMGIVNDFGGTIEVHSEKDLGTTFTVILPAMLEDIGVKRILVIDDDIALLKVYTRWINQAGCEPLLASTGEMGIELLKKGSIDLVLLDQELPDMKGAQILRKIREHSQTLPVVMITGTVERSMAQDFLSNGANDCFFKPLNHVKINTIINQYVRSEPKKEAGNNVVPPLSKGGLEGKRILIVDDEPVVRNVYKAICRRSGLKVVEAGDGKEAVALAGESEFDLILMDIAMPEMDGVTAIKEIKKTTPYTPIVVCTGFLSDSHKEAYQAGALKIITKPVGVKDLIAMVSEVLCN